MIFSEGGCYYQLPRVGALNIETCGCSPATLHCTSKFEPQMQMQSAMIITDWLHRALIQSLVIVHPTLLLASWLVASCGKRFCGKSRRFTEINIVVQASGLHPMSPFLAEISANPDPRIWMTLCVCVYPNKCESYKQSNTTQTFLIFIIFCMPPHF